MKRQDIYRLAKTSLASRKQTSKSTVRGISFGMILLMPVIFIILGLYGDLNRQINKNPQELYANITYVSDDSKVDKYHSIIVDKNRVDRIAKNAKAGFQLDYEQLEMPFDVDSLQAVDSDSPQAVMSIIVGEQAPIYLAPTDWGTYSTQTGITGVLNKEDLNSFVSHKIASSIEDVFLSGFGAGFEQSTGGKGEVIISQLLLDLLNMSPNDVYGKKMTVGFVDTGSLSHDNKSYKIRLDNDNNPDNNDFDSLYNRQDISGQKQAYHFYEYSVKGIIKKQIAQSSPYNSVLRNLFLMSQESFKMGPNNYLRPTINIFSKKIVVETEYVGLATYIWEDNEFEELNKEFACSGAFLFSSLKAVNGYGQDRALAIFNERRLFLDANSYQRMEKMMNVVVSELSGLYSEPDKTEIIGRYSSPMFYNMYMIYTVLSYFILFLSIMGGIIFFAAMVNLFNSIVHSVDSRKHYLAVMRAIGAKDRLIPKLYIAESITLFKRAFLWVVLFGGAICVGIKVGIDKLLTMTGTADGIMGFKISMNFIYVPLSLLVGLGLLLVLGYAFSIGVSRKVSKSPIMSILGES